jgi:hypothetical protein
MRTLGVLCFGEFSRVLNSENNSPIEDLLKEYAIFELDSLTNSDKTFFIESLLLWIHHYRLTEGQREEFKHAIVIEEAHHILLRKKQESTGNEAVTDIILREIRELGESIILIDQHPSLISMPALGNTYTTICMNLKHKADMRTISESLLLDSEQIDFLGQLEIGTAIVKLQGRFFRPFLVKIPLFPLKKGKITDDDIKRQNSGDSIENEVIRLSEKMKRLVRDVQGLLNSGEQEEALEEQERNFLIDIGKFPVSGVTTRYSRLGLNRYQGNKIQKELLDKGLISFRTVSTMKGRLKVLVLSDAGKNKIKDVQIEKIFNKNASWEHEYWKYRAGMRYRKKGYMVIFEYKIGNGKSVDAVAEKGGKKIAIEIETGKSDYLYNIKKNLEHGFDKMIILALNRSTKKKILTGMQDFEMGQKGKIEVLDLAEFSENFHV